VTAELLPYGPADIETIVVAWLTPLRRTAVVRDLDDPLPMCVVQKLSSKEDLEESTSDSVIQVDTLCDKNLGEDAARDEKIKTHQRMLQLGRYLETQGTIDWMTVFESQRREPYGNDQIIRYCARYQFGQTYEEIA
jgi:hypothetical protein